MYPYLEDCPPNRVDIRVHGGKLFPELAGKPELIEDKQLWRHPPNCAPQFSPQFFINRGGVSAITTSPKSAKRTRHSESIRLLTLRRRSAS